MIVRSLDRVSIFVVFSLTDNSPDKPPDEIVNKSLNALYLYLNFGGGTNERIRY